jgi:hypothetical protein
MHGIIQANIDWCKESLITETDDTKRAELPRLLAEQEAKLANLAEPETEQSNAAGTSETRGAREAPAKSLKSDPVLCFATRYPLSDPCHEQPQSSQ